ncbi:MAG: hypothetical protein ACRECW_13315 [Phyllobacterium sp.]
MADQIEFETFWLGCPDPANMFVWGEPAACFETLHEIIDCDKLENGGGDQSDYGQSDSPAQPGAAWRTVRTLSYLRPAYADYGDQQTAIIKARQGLTLIAQSY